MPVNEDTKRRLFVLSGNECAFPKCTNPILDTEHNVIVGEICHIKAKSPNGPRYDASQTDEERNGFANLLLMCSPHNKIIDDPALLDTFTVEVLLGYKQDHESRLSNRVVKPQVVDQWLHLYTLHEDYVYRPALQHEAELLMTKADNEMKIDYYDFRVKLVNEGERPIRNFRIEVEIPRPYADPNPHVHGLVDPTKHNRAKVALYRRTQDAFPGFVLYGGETSDHVFVLSYQLRHDQYATVEEDILVTLYAEDQWMNQTGYPIRTFRNKDRMDQLRLS